MSEQSLFAQCLSAVDSVSTLAELETVIASIRDCYRLSHLVFHVVRLGASDADHPLILSTYPPAWTEYYVENDFFAVDPVVAISRVGLLPVDWSSLDRKTATTRRFFREADTYGVGRFGLTVPVRGPRGERSLLTATSNLREHAWRALRADCESDLQLLAPYIHKKALSVSGLGADAMQNLSRRQLECLDLLAQGRLPKQIAAHLAISESSVRLHLRLARRKLGVLTTTQAVGRAVEIGIIRGP